MLSPDDPGDRGKMDDAIRSRRRSPRTCGRLRTSPCSQPVPRRSSPTTSTPRASSAVRSARPISPSEPVIRMRRFMSDSSLHIDIPGRRRPGMSGTGSALASLVKVPVRDRVRAPFEASIAPVRVVHRHDELRPLSAHPTRTKERADGPPGIRHGAIERSCAGPDSRFETREAVPDRILFVDSLDRTSVGKVDKKRLRSRYVNPGDVQ